MTLKDDRTLLTRGSSYDINGEQKKKKNEKIDSKIRNRYYKISAVLDESLNGLNFEYGVTYAIAAIKKK